MKHDGWVYRVSLIGFKELYKIINYALKKL